MNDLLKSAFISSSKNLGASFDAVPYFSLLVKYAAFFADSAKLIHLYAASTFLAFEGMAKVSIQPSAPLFGAT